MVKRSLSDDIIKGMDRPIPPSTRDLPSPLRDPVKAKFHVTPVFFLETEQNDRSPKLRDFHIFRQHVYGEGEGGRGRGRGGGVGHGRGDDGGGSDGSFGGSFGG